MENKEKAIKFLQDISSDVILRNLSFWLSMAVDKGQLIDSQLQKQQCDAVSESDKDSE